MEHEYKSTSQEEILYYENVGYTPEQSFILGHFTLNQKDLEETIALYQKSFIYDEVIIHENFDMDLAYSIFVVSEMLRESSFITSQDIFTGKKS